MTKKIILVFLLISILFRGWIFRQLITYINIGERENIKVTNTRLLEKIRLKSTEEAIKIEQIIQIAKSITIKELRFSKNQISRNPNDLIDTNQANCIGYAAMFNSIANYLIRENNLEQKYESHHRIGNLELLGFNLNQFFTNPFFQDHDYNEIVDLQKGKIFAIDPSISDYLRIDFVTRKNPEN